MSRDWTPQEDHRLDEWAKKERGEYIHDARVTMKLQGEVVDISCKRYPLIYKKYPNLQFLLGATITKDIHNDGFQKVLEKCEKELSEIIKKDDNEESLCDSVMSRWYQGKQDTSFYYSEENNRLLEEHIRSLMTPTPCDITDDIGNHLCPYAETYTGYEYEMCRNCCGLGVDE